MISFGEIKLRVWQTENGLNLISNQLTIRLNYMT